MTGRRGANCIRAALAEDLTRLDTVDLGGVHTRPGVGRGIVGVDRPAGVLDHEGRKALGAGVERRMGDAKIGRQATGENPSDPAGLQERRETGRRLAVRLDEGRIGIDWPVRALPQDKERAFDREVRMKRRARRSLHAMVRPKRLVAIAKGLDVERLRARMAPACGLWIAWPKRASKVPTDVTDQVIRDVVLPTGLVDNKVCAIDDTWSGLRLVIRKANRV